ncbi:TonB-dependent receptor [Sphingobacterium cellulitidis]|uniref:Membrane protein n=1 Tax=Sphingobacterium cellulitidis TaxID=1768011 RepID=A0A8H9KUM4_9SPHI|nr:carboxypeptidase-like regulatory domain-containing protein [Sphingobacterium soli]MBA8985251.1 outer membrane receptor for ferrienterochelin and colicin [Sphingobacterium soli]GGE11079.1 membrane protein [Sphingobacterium soli]
MRNIAYLILVICFLTPFTALSQQVIQGNVKNKITQEPAAAISIRVKDDRAGTFTDDKGNFQLRLNKGFPATLIISSIGYEQQEIVVENNQKAIQIELNPTSTLAQEIVISASRSVQTKLSSPVTIEQISTKDVQNSPQINYMDMVQGLRGVDVTVSSIGFTSVTTRGFNTSGNTNFTQIVDGMDNQAPGLNFPLGSVIGLTQLDVDNIELLSGASSALYGSRGLNGTMVMTGKDPFKYKGLSVLVTQGVNHINNKNNNDPISPSPVYDWVIRYANSVNDKLAYKINAQYSKANDWVANNMENKNGPGGPDVDPNYNGINMYGGATSTDINPFMYAAMMGNPELAPLIEPMLANPNYVARTGYPEHRYLDNNANVFKVNAELRYRINPNLEAIASGTFGTGNIVYTNDTRYQINDFKVGQYRLELKSDDWFLRTYTTRENSGNTLIAGPTAQLINEAWKVSYDGNVGGWYPEYTEAFITALATGSSQQEAHIAARQFADQGRLLEGTPEFNELKKKISQTPISEGGTLFLDRSKLYNTEFQYNFRKLITFMDVIAGVNWRIYNLDSKNTLFPDKDKPINVNEYSGYLSLGKRLLEERLNLNTSFRLDKNTLFGKPKLTSRASAVFRTANQNYLRFSYQNAYSFPSNIQALQNTMNGYNSFSSGGSNLLLNEHYHFNEYPPYTLASVQEFQQSNDPSVLKKFEYDDIKPQTVNSFELGYAALIAKRVMFDVLGYYSTWENFIGYANVANSPGTDDPNAFKDQSKYMVYNIAFNGGETVNTYGYAASVSVDLGKNFMTKVNYYSDFLKNKNNSQINNFNTPNYHVNMEFGNSGFGKKQVWSFNTTLRYKPGYHYAVAGGLGEGEVPSSAVIDAQISYKILKARSGIRIGGTNITNKYYSTGIANPRIGAMYYVSYAYNIF